MVQPHFAELLGQGTAVELLCQAVEKQQLAPAYLFAGPAGVGRRLAALQFAEILLKAQPDNRVALKRRLAQRNHPDLLWVEPTYLHQGRPVTATEADELGLRRKSPPQIRLTQVREITQFLSRPPLESSRAVVIIEGAETMAEAAANGLLKTLEEPGAATLILLAPAPSALLPTLVSRCQQVPFRRLSAADMATVLRQNGYEALLNQPDVLAMAQGSPGQAIAAWQQLQMLPEPLLQAVRQPPRQLRQALDLARTIAQELDTEAQLWLVDYLQHYYWQRQHAAALHALESARQHLQRFVQPRLVWEVTLMKFLES